jgi:hypothetical protein
MVLQKAITIRVYHAYILRQHNSYFVDVQSKNCAAKIVQQKSAHLMNVNTPNEKVI